MKSPILQPVYLGRVITLGVCLENVKKDNSYKNTRLLSGIKPALRPLVATFFLDYVSFFLAPGTRVHLFIPGVICLRHC